VRLLAKPQRGGTAMDRDLFFYRLSVIWLTILFGGITYILLAV
jgi:hypothetical protein